MLKIMQIRQIKETSLYVHDLTLSRWFYETKLGLKLVSEVEGSHLFFKAGSSMLLLFVPEVSRDKKNPPGHYGGGKQHIAFEVVPEEFYKWQEKLKAENVEIIYEELWPNGLKSFYFNDPEGNVLEIVPEGLWEK
jgi:catechol 2,3-dioxygenase-like lactoylglutathione lyase family enzyme